MNYNNNDKGKSNNLNNYKNLNNIGLNLTNIDTFYQQQGKNVNTKKYDDNLNKLSFLNRSKDNSFNSKVISLNNRNNYNNIF